MLLRAPKVARAILFPQSELLTRLMARSKNPPLETKPDLHVYTFSLTPQVATAIQRLSEDAGDFLGRKVSGSAIIRALVRQVIRQGPSATDALFLEVEKEMNDGVLWGSKKK